MRCVSCKVCEVTFTVGSLLAPLRRLCAGEAGGSLQLEAGCAAEAAGGAVAQFCGGVPAAAHVALLGSLQQGAAHSCRTGEQVEYEINALPFPEWASDTLPPTQCDTTLTTIAIRYISADAGSCPEQLRPPYTFT